MSTDCEERFEKMRLQMIRPLKKNRGRNSLSPIFSEGRGSSVWVTDVFTGYVWKVGQIGEKTSLYQQKRIREERAEYMRLYCLL